MTNTNAGCSDCSQEENTEFICLTDEKNEPQLKPSDYSIFAIKDAGFVPGLTMEQGIPKGINLSKRLNKIGELDNGEGIYTQNLTNENTLKLLFDNINKGNLFYYKAGLGWVQLESNKANSFMSASNQQKGWHDLIKIYQFENKATDDANMKSFSVDSFFGMQKHFINKQSTCRLRVYGEVGGHYSKVEDEFFSGEAGGAFYFQRENSPLTLKASTAFQTKLHQTGVQNQWELGVGAQRHRTSLEFLFTQKSGDLQNHVQYNLANRKTGKIDPIVTIKLRYAFGSWDNKPKKKKTSATN